MALLSTSKRRQDSTVQRKGKAYKCWSRKHNRCAVQHCAAADNTCAFSKGRSRHSQMIFYASASLTLLSRILLWHHSLLLCADNELDSLPKSTENLAQLTSLNAENNKLSQVLPYHSSHVIAPLTSILRKLPVPASADCGDYDWGCCWLCGANAEVRLLFRGAQWP